MLYTIQEAYLQSKDIDLDLIRLTSDIPNTRNETHTEKNKLWEIMARS